MAKSSTEHMVKRRSLYVALFAAVLVGGFFYAVITTLTDDPGVDW